MHILHKQACVLLLPRGEDALSGRPWCFRNLASRRAVTASAMREVLKRDRQARAIGAFQRGPEH